ncbi:MAG: AAA family ATPase [Mongoliitalea sp.]
MLKKVVIIGPESTGKSTLAQQLADHFDCLWVEEYAREYLKNLDRPYEFDDLLSIAQGQLSLEDRLAAQSDELLICDTDLHVIQVWSEHKYGKVHEWVKQQIEDRNYDLYLLTNIDIPWEDDPLREHPDPEMRCHFFELYKQLLEKSPTSFNIISGSSKERLESAIKTVNGLFAQGLITR